VGLRLPAHPLIELIGGDGFDHGNQSDFALIGVLLPVRWTSGGGNRRGLDGFTQMHEASSPGGAGNLPSMRTTDEDLLSNRSRWAKGEQLRPIGSALRLQCSSSVMHVVGLAAYPKRVGQSACHHLLSVLVTWNRSPHAVYAPSASRKPNSEKLPICGNGQSTFINPGGCRALPPTAQLTPGFECKPVTPGSATVCRLSTHRRRPPGRAARTRPP